MYIGNQLQTLSSHCSEHGIHERPRGKKRRLQYISFVIAQTTITFRIQNDVGTSIQTIL